MKLDGIEIEEKYVVLNGPLNVVLNGRHGVVCINRYSPIGRSYLHYGEHAENELGFCRAFIPEGGTVVDVGAHQGTHALVFARHVGPAGGVLAFEPQRQMFQNMLATAALNSLMNIHAINAAVGAEAGTARIKEYDYASRGHFSGMRIEAENSGEQVLMVTLDEVIFSTEGIGSVDFLKIDVEGFEPFVLSGAKRMIERYRPVIYNELHSNSPDRDSILGQLRDMGYKTFLHAPLGHNPNNFYDFMEDRFQGGRDHNAISVHSDQLDRFSDILSELEGTKG